MGILDKVGEVVGAVTAVEALEKVDPGAGLLSEAAAAVAGFEGAGKLESVLEKKKDDDTQQQQDASDDQQATDGTDAQS